MSFVNTSLFVGDLPKFCSESDLEQFYAPFGPVLDVKIKRNVNTGKTLSYGFVTLSNEKLAADALSATDGAMFLGRKLRVRWAMYNAKTQTPANQNVINSVYVRFVTPKVSETQSYRQLYTKFPDQIDEYVTEEDLHRVFDPFGSVLDVSIKESAIDVRANRQSGYGFVHFSCDSVGIEAAFQAVAALDNSTINDITYNVELSKNLLKQFNSNPDLNAAVSREASSSAQISSTTTSPSKILTTPSRSMNNIYQSSPLSISSPQKYLSGSDVSVGQGLGLGLGGEAVIYRSPLRNCSSMNAIKLTPSKQAGSTTTNPELLFSPSSSHSLAVAGRSHKSGGGVPGNCSHNHSFTGPSGGYKTNNSHHPNHNHTHTQTLSRENSFRSMGGHNGSFRTLQARSSSANSMTSSYGTTVSTTSTPSPFVNNSNSIPLEAHQMALDKTQSFRSDPGVMRFYPHQNNNTTNPYNPNNSSSSRLTSGGQYPLAASPRQVIGSPHSLSFHDTPLSQGLFSRHNSDFSSHSHSLLSVPGQNLSELDLVWNSSLRQFESQPPRQVPHHSVVKRPDSRASNCSDVSTDSEEEAVLVSGFEFFSHNNKETDDFFSLLSTKDSKDLSLLASSNTSNHKNTVLGHTNQNTRSNHHHNNSFPLEIPAIQSLNLDESLLPPPPPVTSSLF